MTVYKVIESIDTNDKRFFQVLPYCLFGSIKWYGFSFLKRCRLTEKSANKLKNLLEQSYDIDW